MIFKGVSLASNNFLSDPWPNRFQFVSFANNIPLSILVDILYHISVQHDRRTLHRRTLTAAKAVRARISLLTCYCSVHIIDHTIHEPSHRDINRVSETFKQSLTIKELSVPRPRDLSPYESLKSKCEESTDHIYDASHQHGNPLAVRSSI
ncbi:hypothetical protein BDR04DRAFT_1091085 [Suillus decipiens]|nr:hypothetical protein BDR04DRAFT_1091085 [Suillus decipiens]